MGDAVLALDRVPADDFGFTLGLRDAMGGDRFARLGQCVHLTLEQAAPVRTFRWSRGLGHFPGWWWSVTTGHHVGYESWLERDHVRALDFDRDVVGIASQPFWLHWSDGRRKRRHAPDYFARLADGSGVVIDVRADDAIEPRDAEAFTVTAQACEQVGWRYRRVGVLDPVLAGNVRWLARYRHPRCAGRAEIGQRLREVFASPAPLLATAERAGDRIAVLPALFHLMWQQELVADLAAARLGPTTLVTTVGSVGGAR
ncbi:TnsA-like heteromeric transposase endonuclease subunit [Rhodococcus opacus]|uniref:TnsA-like heteromeric transposase endonuclease subunit n=1 Tax=Rhodococcus opacus TaxID=37919 RepID=UPI0002A242F2|nr:TnsA-like heteromeric transposase endonuclease subunit [Rhodococcus opacus]ELB87308.1 hypothetical protein Rwratislav_40490 [Rhodococcus wratislaviensis IFP 2016]MDX5962012.1 TnsA-like heteromeric transposase endonuclease subunit [Rhodococcus opacus]